MDHFERDLLTSRLLSGTVRLKIQDDGRLRRFILRPPTPVERYEAGEVYLESLQEAEDNGLFTETEAVRVLADQGLWTEADEARLALLERNTEDLKVALFKAFYVPTERDQIRDTLDRTRSEHSSSLSRRYQNAEMTRTAWAALARTRFLIGRCLLKADGVTPVWVEDLWQEMSSPLLNLAISALNAAKLTDGQIREVARTEPWRSFWNAKTATSSVFSVPAELLTDDQRQLVAWTRLYESVHENPECPDEDVIGDDDSFDGWLIIRSREEKRKNAEQAFDRNPRLATCGEIFQPVASKTEAAKIHSLNTEESARTIQRRVETIAKKGSVNEVDLPDVRLKLMTQSSRVGGAK